MVFYVISICPAADTAFVRTAAMFIFTQNRNREVGSQTLTKFGALRTNMVSDL